jgi:hypothetical protein
MFKSIGESGGRSPNTLENEVGHNLLNFSIMKNLFCFFITICLILLSCNTEKLNLNEVDTKKAQRVDLRSSDSNEFERGGISYLQGGIGVSCTTNPCEGNNTGHTDHCQVRSNMNGRFECTCSGCKMTVTFDSYNSEIDVWRQIYSEDLHLEDFATFTRRKHGETLSSFNRIDFNFQPNVTTIIYTYELSDGSEETVMYSNTYTSAGLADKKYEIDCSGSCGCREIFDFNTNRAECSCDPCTLTVTEKD